MATRHRNSVDTHDNHNVTKKKRHHCKSIRRTGHFKLIPLWCIWRKLGHLQPTALSEAICVLCFIFRKASPCTPYRKAPLPVPTKRKCKQKGNQRGWSVKRMEIKKWMTHILVKHWVWLAGHLSSSPVLTLYCLLHPRTTRAATILTPLYHLSVQNVELAT